jgi:hypothetical protein
VTGASPAAFKEVSMFIDAAGEPDVSDDQPDSIEPGDQDALPHIPVTDPADIPPDRGDAGPATLSP